MITHSSAELAALGAVGADHWIETLDDGSHVLIRPLRAEDRERERLFLERLSPLTRKFRFHGEVKIDDKLLDHLMDVDYQRTMAFIALATLFSSAGAGSAMRTKRCSLIASA